MKSDDLPKIVFAVVAACVVVGLIVAFALSSGGSKDDAASGPTTPFDVVTAFAIRCTPCHGPGGGGGGIGPQLNHGAVVRAFPNIQDEIKIVTDGKGEMPAFSKRDMTKDQIRAIVKYTRTALR
jgi:mono/diheme cytochrome c family protein